MLFSFMANMIIDIKKMGINGEGIGYLNKKPVFVDGALAFERVLIDQLKEFPTYYKANLKKVIQQSAHRVKPPCPIQYQCGACSLMHASLKMQKEVKIDNLKQALHKYADIKNIRIDLVDNPKPMGYRNQCKFILGIDHGKIASGMFKSGTNQWMAIHDCIIHDPLLEKVRKQVVALLSQHRVSIAIKSHETGYRYLIIRVLDQKAQVTLVATKHMEDPKLFLDISQIEGVDGVFLSVNDSRSLDLFGSSIQTVKKNKTLDVTIQGIHLRVSPRSFMQLNTHVSTLMVNEVIHHIKPEEDVVEAYCGVGLMSLMAGKKAKSVFGFDISKDAIENAKTSANVNNSKNVVFKALDAKIGLLEASKRYNSFTLIVDPPRTGLQQPFIEQVIKSSVSKMIYVSCNPSTLAKDLSLLRQAFHIESIKAFDMFSHTQHVEAVCVLIRKS